MFLSNHHAICVNGYLGKHGVNDLVSECGAQANAWPLVIAAEDHSVWSTRQILNVPQLLNVREVVVTI